MQTLGTLNLAWVASPAHWAVLALVAVIVLAPGLLPRLGRALGVLTARAVGRSPGAGPGARVEVIPPSSPRATLRRSGGRPLAGSAASEASTEAGERPGWLRWRVPAVVTVAIGVILWWLLHSR